MGYTVLTFLHIPPTCRNVWRFINTLAFGIAVVIFKMDRCTPVFVTAPVIVTEIRKPAFKTLYTPKITGLIIEKLKNQLSDKTVQNQLSDNFFINLRTLKQQA